MSRYMFSSESVTEGHPDKIADQISDAVLDAVLRDDQYGRVACETFITTGMVVLGGEISTDSSVDFQSIARDTIRDIGYTDSAMGFDADTCAVLVAMDQQSPDIAQGVNPGGAGDQGLMFGYASRETGEYMPLALSLSHQLTRRLATVRKEKILPYILPDGKAQVTVIYENGAPAAIDTVVVSTHHRDGVELVDLRHDVLEQVIKPILPEHLIPDNLTLHINPTGKFVVGGPVADAGLTGRKIIVDTYGGAAPHGGGAFSGKDPTKVDRSAAYAARWVAKNVVASGVADQCLIQLAYAIGVADPVSVNVDTRGTGKRSEKEIEEIIRKNFDLTPAGIISALNLRRPIYKPTAAYGHFGREDQAFTWEQTDRKDLFV